MRGAVRSRWPACGLLIVVLGCAESPPECYSGDFRACACDASAEGFQACLESGEGYGECVCDGRTPGLEFGVDAEVGQPDAAPLAGFMEPCGADEACASGLCFPFNAKGPHCTTPCENESMCPSPSPGCNNQGVCKAP